MKFFCGECGPISVNTYFLVNENDNTCAVVDPGDSDFVLDVLKEKALRCKAILLTHGHFDHTLGLFGVKKATGAPVYIHKNDVDMIENPRRYLLFNKNLEIESVSPDFVLTGGETLDICGEKIRVLHTPGHTPGGVCFVDDGEHTVFCGDSVFFESVGRTDFQYSNTAMLLSAIKKRIMSLPDAYILYPGHGNSTSVGHEKAFNPFINC